MSTNYNVTLSGPAPWGFRLQGGKDFNLPLTISRLSDGGKAAKGGIAIGDMVLSIDGVATEGMNHLEAQNKIKNCTGNLRLVLQKVTSASKAPPVAPKVNQCDIIKPVAVTYTPPLPENPPGPYGSGSSKASAFISSPMSAFTPPGALSPPCPSVYNTAIRLYSAENACEVAEGQRRSLVDGQGGHAFNGGPHSILKPPRRHVVDTDIHFYHVPTHADASRKRIMEDTEDWRPRTGTTQSRSFRILAQITGTENAQEEEADTATKTNEEEPEPTSHNSATLKTMMKSPPTTHGIISQCGLITPSFGVKSNGGTAVCPTPVRPEPVAHPNDKDSLVQMAEHYPAGTRTPMCAHCNKVIRGPFLVAMGKSWHKEEFNCIHCRTSVADIGFVEEQGSVYCEHCYEELLAPTCSRCQAKILGEVINALKQTWHVYCFLCASCHQPIRNNTFHLEDGEPYCERDFYSLFGTSCHGCEFPIEAGDKFLEALGYTWHDNCFVCGVCSTSLEGQTFFAKKDKPLCKKHSQTFKI
ncbi:PDZ and LIM domain protein 5a isoform X2 [Stigmatopora argus]